MGCSKIILLQPIYFYFHIFPQKHKNMENFNKKVEKFKKKNPIYLLLFSKIDDMIIRLGQISFIFIFP